MKVARYSFNFVLVLIGTALLVFATGAGCTGKTDEAARRGLVGVSSDSVAVSAVLSVKWDSLTATYDALATAPHTEEQLLEVWDIANVSGQQMETLRASRRVSRSFVDDSLVATETLDSTGTFASSWVSRLVSSSARGAAPFAHWLDSVPPYRSPRRQEDFYFQQLSDTTHSGATLHRYRVVPREASGGLMLAEFATNGEQQVVAFREQRVESAPFFRQQSELIVDRDRVVLDITIDPPARGPRRYRLERVIVRR